MVDYIKCVLKMDEVVIWFICEIRIIEETRCGTFLSVCTQKGRLASHYNELVQTSVISFIPLSFIQDLVRKYCCVFGAL